MKMARKGTKRSLWKRKHSSFRATSDHRLKQRGLFMGTLGKSGNQANPGQIFEQYICNQYEV